MLCITFRILYSRHGSAFFGIANTSKHRAYAIAQRRVHYYTTYMEYVVFGAENDAKMSMLCGGSRKKRRACAIPKKNMKCAGYDMQELEREREIGREKMQPDGSTFVYDNAIVSPAIALPSIYYCLRESRFTIVGCVFFLVRLFVLVY